MGASADGAEQVAHAPGGFRRAMTACKDMFVASVNPRFGRFSYSFTLAVVVGLLTVGSLAGILISLTFKCEKTCSSIPVALLQEQAAERSTLEKLGLRRSNPLKCYGYETSDLVLNDDLSMQQLWSLNSEYFFPGRNIYPLNKLEWQPAASSVSGCSWLHRAENSSKHWVMFSDMMLAFNNVTLGEQGVWDQGPTSLLGAVERNKQFLNNTPLLTYDWGAYAEQNLTTQCVDSIAKARQAAQVDDIWEFSSWLSESNWTMFQTDNMTDKKLRMGVYFTGGTYDGFNWDNNPQSYQYNTTGRILEMWAQVGSASLSSLTNVSASVESDVEQSVSGCQAESFYLSVGLEMHLPSPESAASQYCSTPSLRTVQAKTKLTALQAFGPDGPYRTMLKLTGNFITPDVMLREFLNINCSHPDGSLATWKEDCILAGAAIKYVAPLLTTSTSLLGLWLPQGGAVFEGRKGNASDVQGWWMKTTLYCCKCKYPDIAASLGSALGYQGYVEIIAAALVMALYISIYRKERERLNLDAFGLARIAAEMDNVDKGSSNGGKEDPDAGAVATVMVTATSAPLKAIQMVDTPASPRITRKASRKVKASAALPGVS